MARQYVDHIGKGCIAGDYLVAGEMPQAVCAGFGVKVSQPDIALTSMQVV
jgi:hypothetical protein